MENFNQLYNLYKEDVEKIARFVGHKKLLNAETADDICQKFWMSIFENKTKFSNKNHFISYAYKLISNFCISSQRKESFFVHEVPTIANNDDEEMDINIKTLFLIKSLDCLSKKVFNLRIEGYNNCKIADIIKIKRHRIREILDNVGKKYSKIQSRSIF